MCQTCSQEKQSKQGCGTDEYEKIAVVTTTYAVVEPDAVVVLGFDAIVADTAVVASRWSP